MSSPLPLRICCMAAMAPALTEAASQVRIKATLPGPTSPSVTTQTSVLNGKDHKFTVQHKLSITDSRLALDKVKRPTKQLTNLAGHLLKGGHSVKLNTCNLASNLQNLGVTTAISNLHKKEVSAFQSEFIRSIAKLENGGMNQPASKNENTKPETESKRETSEPAPLVNGKSGVQKNEFKKPVEDSSDRALSPQDTPSVDKKICENDTISKVKEEPDCSGPSTSGILETNLLVDTRTNEDLREIVSKSQFQIERRTEFLMRRLRRLQGRQIDSHTRQQLHHFVEYQHKNLETVVKSINAPVSGTELKTELLQSEDVKNLSTAALVNLVRKLQAPKNLTLNQRIVSAPKTETLIQTTTNILKMDKTVRNESETCADHMCSIIQYTESAVDSDATESSSGGESCDEYDGDPVKEKKVPQTPLHRRAEWKWAMERAGVASRWTWLQAQVSDLEYRIRQQSEIYKQIRNSKGSIVLGDAPSPQNLLTRFHPVLKTAARSSVGSVDKKNEMSPCSISTVLSNVDKQASRLSQSLGNCLTPPQNSIKSSTPSSGRSLNGFIESPIGTDNTNSDSPSTSDIRLLVDQSDMSAVDPTTQAARCRPLRSYRKRKLLRTFGLHQTNRKAARLSSVKCECYPPVMPCPMCGGRYNNTQTVDQDVMPVQERVSLLDSSFHPVLSFPQEIPLPAHFEALLKSGEWQNKPPAKRAKLETERRKYKPRGSDNSRKNNRQIRKNAAAVLLSSKIRSKYENKSVRKGHTGSRKKGVSSRRINKEIKRRAQQLAMVAMKRRSGRSMSALTMSFNESNQNQLTSPQFKDLSLSCPSSALKDLKNRRSRGESAYDINNIVIPYSIAAATRVEKLQYKEIVTPKWRDITKDPATETVIDKKEDVVEAVCDETKEETPNGKHTDDEVEEDNEEEEEEIEDLTDELYTERHLKCEVEEKKRFTSFIQYPSRRNRNRTETNTPLLEPSSPDPNTTPTETQPPEGLADSLIQPIQPPPPQSATPSTPTMPVFSHMLSTAFGSLEDSHRRRSGSVSRRERLSFSSAMDDSSQDGTYEVGEVVDPWPLRTFPLPEEEYSDMKKVQPVLEKLRARVSLEPPSTPSRSDSTPCRSDSTPSSSHPCSPLPSSASNSVAGDDPNDPEWTVINSERTPKKMSVVLKLSTNK